MAYIKPSIFDTTKFSLEITGLSKRSPEQGAASDGGVSSVPKGLSDVVYKASWTLTGKEGNDTLTKSGSTFLDTTKLDSSNFSPFSELTNDKVSSWLINSESFIVHKYTICNNILDNRAVEDTSVPW